MLVQNPVTKKPLISPGFKELAYTLSKPSHRRSADETRCWEEKGKGGDIPELHDFPTSVALQRWSGGTACGAGAAEMRVRREKREMVRENCILNVIYRCVGGVVLLLKSVGENLAGKAVRY